MKKYPTLEKVLAENVQSIFVVTWNHKHGVDCVAATTLKKAEELQAEYEASEDYDADNDSTDLINCTLYK